MAVPFGDVKALGGEVGRMVLVEGLMTRIVERRSMSEGSTAAAALCFVRGISTTFCEEASLVGGGAVVVVVEALGTLV